MPRVKRYDGRIKQKIEHPKNYIFGEHKDAGFKIREDITMQNLKIMCDIKNVYSQWYKVIVVVNEKEFKSEDVDFLKIYSEKNSEGEYIYTEDFKMCMKDSKRLKELNIRFGYEDVEELEVRYAIEEDGRVSFDKEKLSYVCVTLKKDLKAYKVKVKQ